MIPNTPVWRIAVTVPGPAAPAFADALDPVSGAVSWAASQSADAEVQAFCEFEPERATVIALLAATAEALGIATPEPDILYLPPRDWLVENRIQFEPFRIGRFFLLGTPDKTPTPAGCLPLRIDAGMAFGTGRHESTSGCLRAIETLSRRRFANVLDMGCGSGILALAAFRMWRRNVLAADCDPVAVRVARENFRVNGVGPFIRAVAGNGFAAAEVRARAPYDLILANILTQPLRDMAQDVAAHAAPEGIVVLSGFVERDVNRVFEIYRKLGFRLVDILATGDWRAVILRR